MASAKLFQLRFNVEITISPPGLSIAAQRLRNTPTSVTCSITSIASTISTRSRTSIGSTVDAGAPDNPPGEFCCMAMGCAPLLSRGDVIAEVERRSDRRDRLGPLADASHRDVAVVQDAAENALVDIDALDLVEAHFERAPLDEPGLVDHAQIGDVGLGGPAMEPGLEGPVQRRDRHHGRSRQVKQDDAFCDGCARQKKEHDGQDPRRDCRPIQDPVRIGRIQHLFTGLQDIIDITPHTLASITPTPHGTRLSGIAGTRLLAPDRAAMYTRLLAGALRFPCGSRYLSS